MRRLAGFGLGLVLSVAVGGCSGQTPASSSSSSEPAATPISAVSQDTGPFPTPDFTHQSNLSLLSDSRAPLVAVGDDDEVFKAAFPRSATKSRSLDDELPVGATPDHWSAKGWALDNASRGVGALFYDRQIAVVMIQFDNVEESDVSNEVSKYQIALGPAQTLEGKHVRYWFWQRGTSVLMICAFKNDQDEINMTTAVGDALVMARLNMSYSSATEDMRSVERLYGPVGTTSAAANNPQ